MSQPSKATTKAIDDAIASFKAGEPVLVHDFADREGEVDMIYPAAAVEPTDVATMRNDAGGLVCIALAPEVADSFELPFLADEISHPAAATEHLGYDERSSFSLSVNHRDTYTGITDKDRALTIARLGEVAATPDAIEFADEFRAPGHVHVLRAARNGLAERKGHTEMGIALADAAGTEPAAVVCEMLDDETGEALSTADARAYAERHGFPFVEGRELVDALQ